MYGNNSIQDPYFMLLYGLTMMLALGTAVYLLWRRGNAFTSDEAESPVILRRWAAAFFAAAALSHVWWLLLSTVWMTGDKPMRDTTAVALDYLTLIPLMMATLLRMLQDRQRPVWPWIVAEIPVAALALAGIIIRYDAMPYVMTAYQLVVVVVFVAYYIMAVRQYSLWLLAGFADLERKEVWQSLVIIVAIFVTYSIYSTNAGELYREYMAQVVSILIFIILLFRCRRHQSRSPQRVVHRARRPQLQRLHSPPAHRPLRPSLRRGCPRRSSIHSVLFGPAVWLPQLSAFHHGFPPSHGLQPDQLDETIYIFGHWRSFTRLKSNDSCLKVKKL